MDIQGELNRLAGTSGLAEAGAAKVYSGCPQAYDTVGCLNYKAFANQPINSNPDFEAGVSGWTAFGGATIAQSSAQAHGGTQSCLLTTGAAASPRAEADKVPVTEGFQYTASGWIYAGSAMPAGVGINVNWYTAASAFISTSFNSTVPTSGAWELRSAVFTAPATAARAGILLSCSGTPGSGLLVYGDDIRLIQSTPVAEQRDKWLDLAGVCNRLAGTSGLGPAGALARIP